MVMFSCLLNFSNDSKALYFCVSSSFLQILFNLSIILFTPSFPEIVSLSNSNTAPWGSPPHNTAMADLCFLGYNEVDVLQILTSLSQSSYDFEPDSDDGVLLMLDIFTTDGVFLVLSTNY